MKLFYQPENAVLGDVIPFYEHGKYMPFYLKSTRGNDTQDNESCWCALKTTDHLHFSEKSTHIKGGTGSVIHVDGLYHMFYCTFATNPKRGYINHAVSTDMDVWTPLDEVLAPDGKIYGPENFRDPFVFWNKEEKKWWMLMAANAVGRTQRNACVGLCVSDDLHNWKYRDPIYKPMECSGACECPDLFQIGDWYYLVFSYYCDRFQTVYRMSRTLYGPWITPIPNDSFDTRAFYAAKTVSDGENRFVYGWNPTKELPQDVFNPENRVSPDCNSWDWGGTMEVHQVFQNEDGTLRVAPEPHVDQALQKKANIIFADILGDNELNGNNARLSSNEGFAGVLLNKVPSLCKFEADVSFSKGTSRFGVALQVDKNYDRGYYLYLEPGRKRLEFASGIRMYGDGGKMFPYAVELERPIDLVPDKIYKMKIFVQDSILVVYLGDEIALSGRMYEFSGRNFGLFVIDGQAKFNNVQLYTE